MSKTVSPLIKILWFVALLLVGPGNLARAGMGPLHVQNRYPIYLMFLTPAPDAPALIGAGQAQVSIDADYTSVYIDAQNSEWSVLMDMEMITTTLGLTYGLTSRVNLSLALPWISMGDGFLDGPLDTYHASFGFPDYGRPDRPRDEFGYYVTVDGEDWVDGQSGGFHLGETVVSAKLGSIGGERSQGFAASLSAMVKLPTGEAENGFGSGAVDQALVLLARYRNAPWSLYVNPGYVWLSDPESTDAAIQVNDTLTLLLGIEWEADPDWSCLVQFNFMTSPLDHTGIPQLDQDSLELAVGLCYAASEAMTLEFAFCEDITRTAPDFTVHGGLRWTLGH